MNRQHFLRDTLGATSLLGLAACGGNSSLLPLATGANKTLAVGGKSALGNARIARSGNRLGLGVVGGVAKPGGITLPADATDPRARTARDHFYTPDGATLLVDSTVNTDGSTTFSLINTGTASFVYNGETTMTFLGVTFNFWAGTYSGTAGGGFSGNFAFASDETSASLYYNQYEDVIAVDDSGSYDTGSPPQRGPGGKVILSGGRTTQGLHAPSASEAAAMVSAGLACAGFAIAVVAFEATPVGWATTAVAAAAYAWELYKLKKGL